VAIFENQSIKLAFFVLNSVEGGRSFCSSAATSLGGHENGGGSGAGAGGSRQSTANHVACARKSFSKSAAIECISNVVAWPVLVRFHNR
jgi:hypothetical protein